MDGRRPGLQSTSGEEYPVPRVVRTVATARTTRQRNQPPPYLPTVVECQRSNEETRKQDRVPEREPEALRRLAGWRQPPGPLRQKAAPPRQGRRKGPLGNAGHRTYRSHGAFHTFPDRVGTSGARDGDCSLVPSLPPSTIAYERCRRRRSVKARPPKPRSNAAPGSGTVVTVKLS